MEVCEQPALGSPAGCPGHAQEERVAAMAGPAPSPGPAAAEEPAEPRRGLAPPGIQVPVLAPRAAAAPQPDEGLRHDHASAAALPVDAPAGGCEPASEARGPVEGPVSDAPHDHGPSHVTGRPPATRTGSDGAVPVCPERAAAGTVPAYAGWRWEADCAAVVAALGCRPRGTRMHVRVMRPGPANAGPGAAFGSVSARLRMEAEGGMTAAQSAVAAGFTGDGEGWLEPRDPAPRRGPALLRGLAVGLLRTAEAAARLAVVGAAATVLAAIVTMLSTLVAAAPAVWCGVRAEVGPPTWLAGLAVAAATQGPLIRLAAAAAGLPRVAAWLLRRRTAGTRVEMDDEVLRVDLAAGQGRGGMAARAAPAVIRRGEVAAVRLGPAESLWVRACGGFWDVEVVRRGEAGARRLGLTVRREEAEWLAKIVGARWPELGGP